MFHFPHRLFSVQKPTGTSDVGALVYQEVSNNCRCQFLGRAHDFVLSSSRGEERSNTQLFAVPQGFTVELGWRLVYENKGYIVEDVVQQMDMCGRAMALVLITRQELVIDGATNYRQTV